MKKFLISINNELEKNCFFWFYINSAARLTCLQQLFLFVCWFTNIHYNTPLGTARLTTGNAQFSKCFMMRPRSKFSTGTAQKIKFSIRDFFSKCDQISSFLRIWSHLLKKSHLENFIFRAVRKGNETRQGWYENSVR